MGCHACRRDQRSWLLQFLIPQGSSTIVVSCSSLCIEDWVGPFRLKNVGEFFFLLLVQAGKQQPCLGLFLMGNPLYHLLLL